MDYFFFFNSIISKDFFFNPKTKTEVAFGQWQSIIMDVHHSKSRINTCALFTTRFTRIFNWNISKNFTPCNEQW